VRRGGGALGCGEATQSVAGFAVAFRSQAKDHKSKIATARLTSPLENRRETERIQLIVVQPLAQYLELSDINQLWVADITYVRLQQEFAYLAVVLDDLINSRIGLEGYLLPMSELISGNPGGGRTDISCCNARGVYRAHAATSVSN